MDNSNKELENRLALALSPWGDFQDLGDPDLNAANFSSEIVSKIAAQATKNQDLKTLVWCTPHFGSETLVTKFWEVQKLLQKEISNPEMVAALKNCSVGFVKKFLDDGGMQSLKDNPDALRAVWDKLPFMRQLQAEYQFQGWQLSSDIPANQVEEIFQKLSQRPDFDSVPGNMFLPIVRSSGDYELLFRKTQFNLDLNVLRTADWISRSALRHLVLKKTTGHNLNASFHALLENDNIPDGLHREVLGYTRIGVVPLKGEPQNFLELCDLAKSARTEYKRNPQRLDDMLRRESAYRVYEKSYNWLLQEIEKTADSGDERQILMLDRIRRQTDRELNIRALDRMLENPDAVARMFS